MTTIAVIPARGQSKGLARKNLRRLSGRPLVVHAIHAALAALEVDRVVVSTDDADIAQVAEEAGAEVPFRRPAALSGDDTPTASVIVHAISTIGSDPSIVVTLQPTSPLRTAEDIDGTIRAMRDKEGDSAATVCRLGLPASVLGYVDDGLYRPAARFKDARRQAAPPVVRVTGGVYVTTKAVLDSGRILGDRVVAYFVAPESAVDIDTLADLQAARRLLRRLAPR